jgi:hypothetical protein
MPRSHVFYPCFVKEKEREGGSQASNACLLNPSPQMQQDEVIQIPHQQYQVCINVNLETGTEKQNSIQDPEILYDFVIVILIIKKQ